MKLRLSDDKISHLSHVVYKAMADKKLFLPKAESAQVRRAIKQALVRILRVDAEMEDAIRAKIRSYSKPIPEGTPEWEVLYDRFLREAMIKKGIQIE